jgi:KAP family P-loop domain
MADAPKSDPKHAPFIGDEPVTLDRDAFGHRDYARALADMARDDKPPLTIGVFGSWGVGKSTIVAGLKDELAGKVAFAYFDAWRYEEDSLRRQFLRDVGRELKEDGQLDLKEFDPDSDLTELDVDQQETEEGFSLSWPRAKRALAIGAVVGLIAFGLIELGALADFVRGDFGKRFAPAAAAALVAFLAGLFSQWIHITQRVVNVKSLSDPDRFQAKFIDLVKAVHGDRLVIAIDNIDRSSPGKAVEMLSTIKTYLEPAVEPPASSRPKIFGRNPAAKRVIFVVSVDDDALRRHLLSQEQDRSASRQPESGQTEAMRYVDEYLAKFFDVRLPIRRILADDMRAYVGEHLDILITRRGHKEQGTRLIGLVSTALRRNPRRIKQFVNDLEARLRLLEEREKTPPNGQPGIAAPVSKDILVVAKLLLIESEWHGAFERLKREPRRLAEWHTEAEQNDEVWGDDEPSAPSADDHESARTFAAFLRSSRPISSVHVRALIDLRQAPAEAGLSGFAEFREAVINGERAEAQRLMEAATEADRPRYAARLTSVLSDELEQEDFDAARAVVDAALSVEAISSYEDARGDVVAAALESAQLREQLRQLDPGPAVEASRSLSRAKRDLMFGVVVTRMLDDEESFPSQERAANALTTVADDLTEELQERIRAGIESEALRNQFKVYVNLAEAAPSVLPQDAAEWSLEALTSWGEGLSWDGDVDASANSAFRVLLATLTKGRQPQIEQPVFDQIIQSLDQLAGNEQLLGRVIDRGKKLVDAIQEVDPSHPVRLAQRIQERWDAFPASLRPELIQLLAATLDKATEDVREGTAVQVASEVFADPGTGIALASELSTKVPAVFQKPFADHLAGLLTNPSYRDTAAGVLEELSPPDLDQRIADAALVCIQQTDADGANVLIDRYPQSFKSQGARIAPQALDRAQELANANQAIPFSALARLARWMDAAQTERFAELISGQFATASSQASAAVDALTQTEGTSKVIDKVLETALSNLEAMPQISGPHMAMLDLVVGESERLETSRLDGLVTRLEVWLNEQPDQRVEIAERIGRITNLSARQRERLVRFLIAAEKREDQQPMRLELLRTANRIKGRANSRANGAFEDRLNELEAGDEQAKALAQQLREQQA